MKRWIALLLCLVMALGLMAGCGKEEESIVGTWETEVDISEMLADVVSEAVGSTPEVFAFEDLKITLVITFNEEGTYEMSCDEASAQEMFDELMDQMPAIMTAYLEELLQGTGVTVDQALAAQGTTMEELIEQSFSNDMVDDMVSEMETNGDWEIEDGKLYLDGEECEYDLSGDELTIDIGDEDVPEQLDGLLPLEFKRK